MEGNVPQDYLQQGEVNYDDLMNNPGWPVAPSDQFTFSPVPPPQPNYQQYTTSQPSFDQYQQPAYTSQYSASPYVSQYPQHGVPPEAFAAPSYNVDPSLQNPSLYNGSGSPFSFAPQETTISPQSLQYHAPPSQPMHPGVSNSSFQQGVNGYTPMAQEQSPVFFSNTHNAPPPIMPVQKAMPVQYPPVPTNSLDYAPKPVVKRSREGEAVSKSPQQIKVEPARSQLRITDPELHASNNKPPGPRIKHAPFIAFSGPLISVPSSVKVPKYPQRRSNLEQRPIPGFDISRILTLAQSSSTKIRPPKEKKISVSRYKGTAKPPADRSTNLRGEDGSLTAQVKEPPSPTDFTSSEEDSSSEEESEEEDDEMPPLKDVSEIRGSTRPLGGADAARWDAIGIVWKDPNYVPSAGAIKSAIEDYGTFVGTLRLQLKANSTKIEQAEKDLAEVAHLRQGRTILLDSLYEVINAANTQGYAAIVENLGGHEKLVHGLTTTLIECIKADDFLGRLPKAIFGLLAKFQTMTEALLKRLRFDSIQKRWSKKGDDQIKKNIASILANTVDAKERASKLSKDATPEEEGKKLQEKTEQAKIRKPDAVKGTPNVTSAKRPHEGDPAASKPNKKFATDTAATTVVATKVVPPKRPTNILANNLLGITSKPAAKPTPKKRDLSPPAASKLGALLASIAKAPEPPKAPEAPPRAPETPEEKKRRERKESRRHLRVRFKEGPDLEQIRMFKHELAEDEGRQDDMLRDAHDDRSEGMMHKKRVSENLDESLEDDDALAAEMEDRPYPSLVPINFSGLDKATTFGPTYTTRGGDKSFSTPEQQTQERREALELMVIYTDPKDIPPSAKEPPQDNRDIQQERQLKGPSEPWMVNRMQEIQQYGPDYATQVFFNRRGEEQRLKEIQLASSASDSSVNISSLLQQLGGPGVSQKPGFAMDPTELQNLMHIVGYLKAKPYPPTEPPDWLKNEAQRADWWAGYNRENVAHQQHMQGSRFEPQMPAPQMQPYQQQVPQSNMVPLPQATNDVAQQVQAYLAGLTASGNRTAPTPQQYDFNALTSGHFGKENQPSRWDAEWDNGASRSKQYQDNHVSNGKLQGHETKQWGGGHNDSLFDENGEYKGKKKPCKFWGQGKCAKGAKCTFLHDEED